MTATTGTNKLEPKTGSSGKPAGSHASPVVPFLDLKTQFSGIRDEVLAAVTRVLDSQQFILGSEVTALENELAAYVGVKHAIACASGSDALLLSLMALELNPGDEVITVPFTFVATAACIARLQARTVFVDILPGTYNIDPLSLEKAITPRTKAIIPVHLFGLSRGYGCHFPHCRKARNSCHRRCRASHRVPLKGKAVGTLAAMGCFSFFPSKNLGGAGDGGLITTDDNALADKLKVLRVHGGRPDLRARVGWRE